MRFNRLLSFVLAAGLAAIASASASGASFTVSTTDQKQAPVSDLVVWLTPLDAPLPPAIEPGSATTTVNQQGEEFHPYTSVVRVGTRVMFPNLDDVQHHVYSLSRPAQFEIPLHGGATHESVILNQAGVVPVGCNIHDWMLSYVVVVETPWFATSNSAGQATVSNLPTGRYHLTAWHPRLKTNEELDVVIGPDDMSVALTLKLRPDRRIRRAPDASGKAY